MLRQRHPAKKCISEMAEEIDETEKLNSESTSQTISTQPASISKPESEVPLVCDELANEHEPEVSVEEEQRVECDLFDIRLSNLHDALNLQADRLKRRAYEQKEQAGRIVRKTLDQTKTWVVCHFNHLPTWLQDNEFLHVSHRPQLGSFKQCFKSIFRMHSETGNIWTHLIGCFMFLIFAVYVGITLPDHMRFMDKFMFGVFFLGVILCLAFSFIYHTVSCHSLKVGKLFSKLDYCGISLLIACSMLSVIYYMFYCDRFNQMLYLIIVSVLCLSTMVVSLWDKFSEPNFRTIRAGVFIVFGCFGVIPTFHWILAASWPVEQELLTSFIYLLLMGSMYIFGALLYAGRIPERFFPGRCDYWFQSHQIFHILVIIAAVLHHQGINEMAAYRLSYTCDNQPIQFNQTSR